MCHIIIWAKEQEDEGVSWPHSNKYLSQGINILQSQQTTTTTVLRLILLVVGELRRIVRWMGMSKASNPIPYVDIKRTQNHDNIFPL